MHIDIITVLPELLDSPLNHSILKRAKEKGLVEINVHDLRDYSLDQRHRRVDDYPYGGAAGMVMTSTSGAAGMVMAGAEGRGGGWLWQVRRGLRRMVMTKRGK